MFSFLATVFGFSFIYWGLDKIDSSHFAGDTPVGFWAFTGFSLSTLLPSSIGHVEASSGIAQVVAHVESICSLLLIGIGFSFLFNSQRKQIRADLDQVLDEIGESAKALESHLGDTYQLKCEDLEDLLIEKSLVIVNLMRKMRGMEERRPLEEESNDAAGYIESEAGPALEAGPSPESPTDADTEQARP